MNSAFTFPVKPVLARRTRRPRPSRYFVCCSTQDNTNNTTASKAPPSSSTPTSRRAFLSAAIRFSGAASILSVADDVLAAENAVLLRNNIELGAAAPVVVPTTRKVTWGYVDEIGPDKWGQLSEDWRLCDAGRLQSPIELSYKSSRLASGGEQRPTLTTATASGRAKFCVRHKEPGPGAASKWLVIEPYAEPPPQIIGDAPPLDVPAVKSPVILTLPNVGRYRLKKIHFHTNGSEHVLNGQRSAMEAHFVFALDKAASTTANPTSSTNNSNSNDPTSVIPEKEKEEVARGAGAGFVVVGLLINEEEETTPWLSTVLDTAVKPSTTNLTENKNRDDLYSVTGVYLELDVDDVLPNFNESNLYTYDGSLTTPPGTEGIHWIVMNDRAAVTKQDCALLQEFQGGPNTRPLQNANEREVVQFPALLTETEERALV